MRVAALNVTQSDDFNIVLNLISQLSNVLKENRTTTNELIAVADTLDTDDDDETDSESVSYQSFFYSTDTDISSVYKLCRCEPSTG